MQHELFPDEMDKPRVFRCIAGAYIGRFNRDAGPDDSPTVRMSAFMPSMDAAEAALAAGAWPAPETEEAWAARVSSEPVRNRAR